MTKFAIRLMGAAATLAIAIPAFAMSHADRAIVETYRDKIAVARAEPGVAAHGVDALAKASAELPLLAQALDDHKTRRVAELTSDIDTQIEIARTRTHAAMAQRDAATIGAAKAEAADARADAAAAQDAAASAQVDAATQAANASNARAEADRLRSAMADYQMKQTQFGATLVLQDVVFETGKADLKPGASDRLRPLAQYLQANPNVQVRIDGHTDAQGSETMNQQLSEARAGSVRAALASMGVDQARIQAIGHGKGDPVADNKTEAGRQQNRRVEVTLVGQPASAFGA
ncbi:MAG TPA: OmpA family protein [Sphingomonas sp.]|uniref:OmpA family protein n=1 Tax=Sphingomonas sp. TaxID=28214 RepID=UPI002C6BF963|nr:OmpA family protein [Sphingomonas sp.]HMI20119.1 OmpA family protein [Sphingomonas sp.]